MVPPPKRPMRVFFGAGLVGFSLVLAFWFLPFFRVDTLRIQTNGPAQGNAAEREEAITRMVEGKHMLEVMRFPFMARLESFHPEIASAQLSVRAFPKLTLVLTLRTPVMVYTKGADSYLVDSSGVVYGLSEGEDSVLSVSTVRELSVGSRIASEEVHFYQTLSQGIPGFSVSAVTEEPFGTVRIIGMWEGKTLTVVCNATRSAIEQWHLVRTILTQAAGAHDTLTLIDVRFERPIVERKPPSIDAQKDPVLN